MIKLPEFHGTHCLYFQACGALLGKATSEEEVLVATHAMSNGKSYVRFYGGGPTNTHLHIDIADAVIFPRRRRPKTSARTATILKRLAGHKGERVDILILGRYLIDVKETNPETGLLFTGPRSVVSTINDATVEVTGARLAVRNDQKIEAIDWDVYDDGALIDIYGTHRTKVSDSYLTETFDIVQTAFATYILGRANQ